MRLIKTWPAILAALLVLFAGCNMPIEPNVIVSTSDVRLSQVQVTIGGNARTILPDLGGGFSKFVLSAESVDGNTYVPAPLEIKGNWGTIGLPYGEWIITATAYVKVNGTDYAAARGSAPIFVFTDSQYLALAVNTPELTGTGTFTYKVTYPASGSASVKLESWPSGTTVVNVSSVVNGVQTSNNVPSGVYFLTVTTTGSGKTVIRNEIVHIYQQSTTNAEYIFTKLDFGAASLALSGTVKFLVNGTQPSEAYIYYSTDQRDWSSTAVNFTGSNGDGIWSVDIDQFNGKNTIYFRAGFFNNVDAARDLGSIPVPLDDQSGINLGTVAVSIIQLTGDTWVNGEITTSGGEDWYSINVTNGTIYYLWWNDVFSGNGTKTLYATSVQLFDNDSNTQVYSYWGGYGWDNPYPFIANSDGTVYIKVSGYDSRRSAGTYAIAYSTNSHWHNNPFSPPAATPLTADTWHDGEIIDGEGRYSEDWYSIDVIAGTTYYFWGNSDYFGDGTKTLLYMYVDVYNSGGYNFYSGNWVYWDNPFSFTAISDDTVYIRVQCWWDTSGTYAFVYSTTNTRP